MIIVIIIIIIIPIIIIYNYNYNRINFRKELVLFIIWKYIINNVDLLCEIKDLITNGIANDTPLKNIINKLFIICCYVL